MGRTKWTPEQKAAASARAKARGFGKKAEAQVSVPATNGSTVTPMVATFEQMPRRFVQPKDDYHYVLCEKKPTNLEMDYQGDKFIALNYELVPDRCTRQFDVFRIPRSIYEARRKAKGQASTDASKKPVEVSFGDKTRITQNTIESQNMTPQEFFAGAETAQ